MYAVGETEHGSSCADIKSGTGRLLELFLYVYSLRCEESGIEMNSRAVQAAIDMQDAFEQKQHDVSSTHTKLLAAEYTLIAVPLGVGGSSALIPALACMPLAKINLSDCYLGDAGTRIFVDSLSATGSQCCDVLDALTLTGVGISDASPLSVLVTAARRLKVLDVSRNKIGVQPQGLAVFCAALYHHNSLREVILCDNMISGSCPVSVRAISEWIVCAGHKALLQRIDLRFNALGFTREAEGITIPATKAKRYIYGSHPFVDALLFNNTLEFFELYGNALAEDVLDVIEARLAVNRRTKKTLSEASLFTRNE